LSTHSLETGGDAQREAASSRTILQSLPGIFCLCDAQGRMVRWNGHLETVSGYTGREIEAMHPLDFIVAEDRALVERRIGEIFARGAAQVEAGLLSKNRSVTPYLMSGRLIAIDGGGHMLAVGIDISERERTEEQIRRQLSELHRWREVTLGREERVSVLKTEVNALLAAAGHPPRYADAPGGGVAGE